jgi:ParB family chromosome partitioning protein
LSQIEITDEEREHLLSDDQEIAALADRIKDKGLVQPVVLNRVQEGQYRIVAGHMRVEACKRLGWRNLPAVVKGEE